MIILCQALRGGTDRWMIVPDAIELLVGVKMVGFVSPALSIVPVVKPNPVGMVSIRVPVVAPVVVLLTSV